MCYFLYGTTDKSINRDDFEEAMKKSPYKFPIGTKHDVKMCTQSETDEYFVTGNVCDCDFPVGMKDESAEELLKLASLINDLRFARDSTCIYLSKSWIGRRNKREKTVNLIDVDIVHFLANMEIECLYRIDFH